MTPQQIALIRQSFQKVVPIADKAADLFYDRLFTVEPSYRDMFPADMTEQKKKLMAAIGAVVAGLDKLDTILPTVQSMGRKHAGYGVKAPDYDTVGAALLWTLQQGLGPDWNDELKDAWATAYTTLAHVMIEAAKTAKAA